MSVKFDDGKDDGALRTIGEVGNALGLKPHVLRYWEQQFPGLQPLKRSGGRRYYRPADVAMIERIDALVNGEGYTLKGAEAALKSAAGADKIDNPDGEKSPDAARQSPSSRGQMASPDAAMQDIIAQLKSIRGELSAALEG